MGLDKIQTFKINPQDAERLERLATARGVSVGAVIRDAIRDAIGGPAEALRLAEQIQDRIEMEYSGRLAVLEAAKKQIEEKIQALSEQIQTLTTQAADLLEKENATEDPAAAMELRKQCAEVQALLELTRERLNALQTKREETLKAIAALERAKNEQIKENLRQEFPRICENLLDGLSMRIIATAEALRPYVKAFATPATDERVLARFLRLRLSRQVRQISDLAFDILGRPDAFNEDNFRSWPSFWKFWSWQTHFPVSVKAEDSTVTEKKAEDQAETKRIEIEL
jgi:DNA repair exonuclease SbcCD ATPase subunit